MKQLKEHFKILPNKFKSLKCWDDVEHIAMFFCFKFWRAWKTSFWSVWFLLVFYSFVQIRAGEAFNYPLYLKEQCYDIFDPFYIFKKLFLELINRQKWFHKLFNFRKDNSEKRVSALLLTMLTQFPRSRWLCRHNFNLVKDYVDSLSA